MPDPIRPPGPGADRWSRRAVLTAGLAFGAGGCSLSDPAVRRAGGPAPPGPRPTPTPTPTPFAPGLDRDLSTERTLAASARTLRTRTEDDRRRRLLGFLERAHDERAAALAGPDPTVRPTAEPGASPSPTPTGSPTPAGSLRGLADAERSAAARYRTAALSASGLAALLWGSMAVAGTGFARALEVDEAPAVAPAAPHRPLALVSDTEAVSALVGSLHAVVWGYQLALGRLPSSGAAHDRALEGLRGRRALQDRLIDQLVQAGVEVPAAAPAYQPDPEVSDAASAQLLIRRMETRLLPFCGLWLAATARTADRKLALDTLGSTLSTATTWGAPLPVWPGWAD